MILDEMNLDDAFCYPLFSPTVLLMPGLHAYHDYARVDFDGFAERFGATWAKIPKLERRLLAAHWSRHGPDRMPFIWLTDKPLMDDDGDRAIALAHTDGVRFAFHVPTILAGPSWFAEAVIGHELSHAICVIRDDDDSEEAADACATRWGFAMARMRDLALTIN